MENLGYYNGKIGLIEEMTVPMTDRGLFFGDGVYDATCAVNHTLFALEDHMNRFTNSLAGVRIKPTQTREELTALLCELVKKVDSDCVMVYWQMTRGSYLRGHAFPPEEIKPNLLVFITPFQMGPFDRTLRLITREDTRYYHCNIKTLNLLPNVLAAQATKEAGCDEVVFHRGDRVTEGCHSNIMMISGGALCTPPADELILPGITRKHLMQTAEQLGMPVREAPFTVEELMQADEVLVTSSGSLCSRVTHIDGKPVGGRAGEMLRRLQLAYGKRFNAETGGKVYDEE
ncbi:aminotransferase class IV [Acidaminobacterium chupaoyuni]